MAKLDLMNNRSPIVQQTRVFDSMEYSNVLENSVKYKPRVLIDFNTYRDRPDMVHRHRNNGRSTGDTCDKPPKIPSFKFKSEIPFKESYFEGNEAAKKFYCFKERISSPILNKILDKEHDIPDDGIMKSIEKGLVPGGNWSHSTSERKPLVNISTHLGPGDYDVTRFERSAQGSAARNVKFHDTPTGRAELKYVDVPTPTTYNPQHDVVLPRNSLGVIPFSSVSRTNNIHYRVPGYVTTSGLILAPDFDNKDGWENPNIPITLNSKGPRLSPPPEINSTNQLIQVDCGNKMSLSKSIATSPVKFAASFKYVYIFVVN
jgi:hypothetical protein